MKRLILFSLLALTLIILTLWGDMLVGRTLDAQLAPLLSRQLGLPVTLEPIEPRLLRLTASSPKLVMGDPDDPAVVALDVEVRLDLSDLVRGEIRLAAASAGDLMVRPSRWPSSGDPLPKDYLFLDPWLPGDLQLEQGRYVAAGGSPYPVRQFHWQRPFGGGATLDWSEDRAGGQVELSASLNALEDLLRLNPLSITLTARAADSQDSTVTLETAIKPGDSGGYRLDSRIEAGGMTAKVVAGSENTWQLPTSSDTRIATLDLGALRGLVKSYTGKAERPKAGTGLDSSLPALSLPPHEGSMSIDELRVNDEIATDNSFAFTTGEQGVTVSSLAINGPAGRLQGHFQVTSADASWQVKLEADLAAHSEDHTLAPQYLDADWMWHAGQTRLHGSGDSWGHLLNSLEGDITLQGFHRGQTRTPVTITTRLDNRPGEFTLEQLDVEVGGGSITGTLTLSGDTRKTLALDVRAQQLNLDFLFEEASKEPLPGIAEPTFLANLPGLDLDFKIDARNIRTPQLNAASAAVTVQRSAGHTQLTARVTGLDGGQLDLNLDALVTPDQPSNVTLSAHLEELNTPKLLQQQAPFNSHSSGSIIFQSRGNSVNEVFSAMRGKADLTMDLRADDNWHRDPSDYEELSFSGDAELVVKGGRVLGLKISHLNIDSTQQDLTGSVSFVADRTPWLIADLESEKLDIEGIRALLPESTQSADETNLLGQLRKLGPVRLSLDAKSVTLKHAPLADIQFEASSGPDRFAIDRLDFTLEQSPFKSRGEFSWQGERAAFKASASVRDFDLDRFLVQDPAAVHVPVSGSVSLESNGRKFAELLANLSGHADLAASQPRTSAAVQDRRKLKMRIERVPDGMHASISTLQWGQSDLAADLNYHRGSPPVVELELKGGTLSLEAWERAAKAPAEEKPEAPGGSIITRTANASASLLNNVLSSPFRLLGDADEAGPGEKFFSADPLPFDTFQSYNARVHGHIDQISSNAGMIGQLDMDAKLSDGRLAASFTAGQLNQGDATLQLEIDSTAAPASVKIDGSFDELLGREGTPTYPRSGFVSMTSRGGSEAELADNLTGQALLKLGRGPYNYDRITFLNTDVATRMFRTLIPGLDKSKPELECGLALFTFKDGAGVTPYGFAARTQQANLIGRMEVDLGKETIQLEFDSRSREGVGLSVGSMFSNTVRVEGPLNDPKIVPRTGSILWRGWAAFMTAGLSVVGESVLKRTLASADPCESIRKQIGKDLCGTDQPAASSPLICPQGQRAALQ